MASTLSRFPLVVIVGPTASGKTALAIDLAKQLNGEIVCADSRTIYKGLDIGTAKPTKEEQEEIRHWGVDLVEPGERFTAFDFQKYAKAKISEIRSRGHVPFLVGGSGLYIDAVVFDYTFGSDSIGSIRRELEDMSIMELHEYCDKNYIEIPNNAFNKRYIIRAIEQKGINTKRRHKPISNTIIVGITTEKEILKDRIAMRTEKLFGLGVVHEVTNVTKKYGWDHEAMTGNIYQVIKEYLGTQLTLEEAKSKCKTLDWQLAKRQLTWFKRNAFINWYTAEVAYDYIRTKLANG